MLKSNLIVRVAVMLSLALVLGPWLSLRTKSQSLVLALALSLESLVLSLALRLQSLLTLQILHPLFHCVIGYRPMMLSQMDAPAQRPASAINWTQRLPASSINSLTLVL